MFRIAMLSALTLLLLPILPGCEGAGRHDVYTDEYGTLRGLEITPEPQSLSIDTSDVFYLDWQYGYDPPEEFTVSLREVHADGTTDPLYTVFDEIAVGHYRLAPSWYLAPETFLLLTVSDSEDRVRAVYLTESSGIVYTPTRRHEGGEAEHTVQLKK